jgi:ABC-type uncharacterized transport system substrate-binding protein
MERATPMVFRSTARRFVLGAAVAGFAALVGSGPAGAHPHAWIDATVAPIFDEAGRFTAVRETWWFDYEYSLVVSRLLDPDGDGRLSIDELVSAIGEGGVLSWIASGDYLTRATIAGREVPPGAAATITVGIADARLVVDFTLPLTEPQVVTRGAGVDVFDRDLTFGIRFAEPAIDGSTAPRACKVDRWWAPDADPLVPDAVAMERFLQQHPYAVRVQIACSG